MRKPKLCDAWWPVQGLLVVLAMFALGACDKPSEDSCRKALLNIQQLMGTDTQNDTSFLEGEVRRCRGGSRRAAVECATKATTLDELQRCDFFKVNMGSKTGSATGSAGNAGNAAGSATSSAGGNAGSSSNAGSGASAGSSGSAK